MESLRLPDAAWSADSRPDLGYGRSVYEAARQWASLAREDGLGRKAADVGGVAAAGAGGVTGGVLAYRHRHQAQLKKGVAKRSVVWVA